MRYTAVWAHRGASYYAPENTLPAFLLAASLGADGIELDVNVTADNVVVVNHDHNIDRTSTGKGNIIDMTLEELKTYDFGCPETFGNRFAGTKISTLEEVFEAVRDTGMNINVELKYTAARNVPLVLAVAQRCGMKERVIYSSFDHPCLAEIMQQDKTAITAPLYGEMENPCEAALEYGAKALHPWVMEALKPGYVEEAHSKGLRVHPYTIDNPEIMTKVFEADCDAIITNRPDIAKKLRDAHLKSLNK